jgi:catechol 2,3-dioxygenase-like lactoylglutathione lyase family enzyme
VSLPRLDHVGITVRDLDEAVAFFGLVGLEPTGERQVVTGEFLWTVCGVPDSEVLVATVAAAGTDTAVELSQFLRPVPDTEGRADMATEPGLRNLCLEVADLRATVATLDAAGYPLVGGIADWREAYRMAYVRGPDGIILALAQSL